MRTPTLLFLQGVNYDVHGRVGFVYNEDFWSLFSKENEDFFFLWAWCQKSFGCEINGDLEIWIFSKNPVCYPKIDADSVGVGAFDDPL